MFRGVDEGSYQMLEGEEGTLYLRLYTRVSTVELYTWYTYTDSGWDACDDEKSNQLDKQHEEQYAKQ
jgi:hypothetical protein